MPSPAWCAPSPMSVAAKGHVELPVTGMTCASCAARIQRRLNRLEGVSATVNYATETATVDFDPTQATVEDLVASVVAAGYGATLPAAQGVDDVVAGDEGRVAVLRRRLVVSAILSVPVVALAMIPALQFDRWAWVAGILAAPVVFWGGWGFHRAAWINLRHRTTTMDTLISLGSLAAFGWSVAALLFLHAGDPGGPMNMNMDMPGMAGMSGMAHRGAVYFEVAATVITLILLGRYFEARAKRRAGAALAALLALGAKDVAVIDDDGERRIPINGLRVGMRFVVRPGEKVATDGTVVEGRSAIDASLLTGENLPVEVGPGDPVTGSTVNVGGRVVVVATRVGADTALARIGRLVVAAQTGKAPVQRLADRVSLVFVPAVIVIAAGTLLTWLAVGASAGRAFTAAVAVLIVACPCALGLATPTAILVGSGRGAQLGLLIKGPEVLESTRRVDTIVLDKTGTLTTGKMSLVSVATIPGVDAAEALRLVGAVEDASEHPIGRAIAAAARAAGPLPPVDSFTSHRGVGAEGDVAGHRVLAGRPSMLSGRGVAIPAELRDAVTAARSDGRIAICAGWDGQATAVFVVADTVKATSAEAVAEFRALGLRPILLTGDNETTAQAVAAQVDITEVVADVLPEGKADVVKGLQGQGRVVAMVGDGVNDAPALAQADLGLAMGTGTDAAFEASDLTVMSADLRLAADAIRLSRRTLRIIQSNLFWAFAYNVVALPIAAAGWLNPMIAGAAMASSSVFVVSNSLRLRRFQPQHQAWPAAPAPAAIPVPVAS